ncbi:MAG: DUF192 domain-containing protein [Candidatus Obscuribacterales bacterium]|nr:DUF192 domain-containing protein [Candidatus Obscuribacterales bacterium]
MINKKQSLAVVASLFLLFTSMADCLAKVPLARFGKNTVKLEVADTREKIERGLMYRRALEDGNGMVFLFHPSSAVRFWMFHCFISLDMIFIYDGKIAKISHDVPPCKETDPALCPLYPSEGTVTVTEVVEVPAGYCKRHGIKEGDTVKFEFLDSDSDAGTVKPATTGSGDCQKK